MTKYLRPILIGLAVGFAVSFSLGLLMGAAHIEDNWTPMWTGAFIGCAVAFMLANLAGNRKVDNASAAERAEALKLEPPAGKALLVVYRKGYVGKAVGLNLSVDGKVVAQLKAPRFTVVAVAPGPHAVTAAFGGLAGGNTPAEHALEAVAGGVTVLRAGLSMGMIKNTVTFTPQDDLAAVKARLAKVTMVSAEAAAA
ncbi:MAG: hypothetical protein ACHP7N_13755 [Caulobacterales bacterium]